MCEKDIDIIDVVIKLKELYEKERDEQKKMKLLDAYLVLLERAVTSYKKCVEQFNKELA